MLQSTGEREPEFVATLAYIPDCLPSAYAGLLIIFHAQVGVDVNKHRDIHLLIEKIVSLSLHFSSVEMIIVIIIIIIPSVQSCHADLMRNLI